MVGEIEAKRLGLYTDPKGGFLFNCWGVCLFKLVKIHIAAISVKSGLEVFIGKRVGAMAPCIKVQASLPEFDTQDPRGGGKSHILRVSSDFHIC